MNTQTRCPSEDASDASLKYDMEVSMSRLDHSEEVLYSRYHRLSAFLLDHSICPGSVELNFERLDNAAPEACRVKVNCPACRTTCAHQISYPNLLRDVSECSHVRLERLDEALSGEANRPQTEAVLHSFLLAVAAECLVQPDSCLSRNDP